MLHTEKRTNVLLLLLLLLLFLFWRRLTKLVSEGRTHDKSCVLIGVQNVVFVSVQKAKVQHRSCTPRRKKIFSMMVFFLFGPNSTHLCAKPVPNTDTFLEPSRWLDNVMHRKRFFEVPEKIF
jgi:hypothetical protein